MNKWVQDHLVDKNAPIIKARVETFHGGGQLTRIIIPARKWIQVRNGGWMQVEVVKRIGAAFKGASVIWLKDAVLLTTERYCYTFKTRPRDGLTTKSTKGEEYQC